VHLPDDVPEAVKRERVNRLLDLQLSHQEEAHRALHGQTVEILVEGASKTDDSMLHGRTLGSRSVVFPRPADRDVIGSLVQVRIDHSTSLTLFGALV
jgi:tRNA-2-methylthio-N6-dimethylallyladenosine synthase